MWCGWEGHALIACQKNAEENTDMTRERLSKCIEHSKDSLHHMFLQQDLYILITSLKTYFVKVEMLNIGYFDYFLLSCKQCRATFLPTSTQKKDRNEKLKKQEKGHNFYIPSSGIFTALCTLLLSLLFYSLDVALFIPRVTVILKRNCCLMQKRESRRRGKKFRGPGQFIIWIFTPPREPLLRNTLDRTKKCLIHSE